MKRPGLRGSRRSFGHQPTVGSRCPWPSRSRYHQPRQTEHATLIRHRRHLKSPRHEHLQLPCRPHVCWQDRRFSCSTLWPSSRSKSAASCWAATSHFHQPQPCLGTSFIFIPAPAAGSETNVPPAIVILLPIVGRERHRPLVKPSPCETAPVWNRPLVEPPPCGTDLLWNRLLVEPSFC